MEVEAIFSSSTHPFVPISTVFISFFNLWFVSEGSRSGAGFCGAIVIKVHDFQVAELVEVRKKEASLLQNPFSDGLVQSDNS
jgi:hypothetical protein